MQQIIVVNFSDQSWFRNGASSNAFYERFLAKRSDKVTPGLRPPVLWAFERGEWRFCAPSVASTMSAARRSRPAAQANRQLTFSRRQTLSRFGSRLPERFDLGFNKDADKIASTCVPADRQIEDFSVIRKRATPNNIERFGLLGQYDSTISKRECIGGVANRLAMTARFKFRILRSLLEEVREGESERGERLPARGDWRHASGHQGARAGRG